MHGNPTRFAFIVALVIGLTGNTQAHVPSDCVTLVAHVSEIMSTYGDMIERYTADIGEATEAETLTMTLFEFLREDMDRDQTLSAAVRNMVECIANN